MATKVNRAPASRTVLFYQASYGGLGILSNLPIKDAVHVRVRNVAFFGQTLNQVLSLESVRCAIVLDKLFLAERLEVGLLLHVFSRIPGVFGRGR